MRWRFSPCRAGARLEARAHAAVIPHGAVVATGGGLHRAEDGFEEEAGHLALAVELELARGRDERMPVEDDRSLSIAASDDLLESEHEIEFLAGEELQVEAADLAKCGRTHEDK